MTSEALRVEHIAQPAVLVDDLDAALDWISAVFKAYPSERVDIAGAGVNNAVYAFAVVAGHALLIKARGTDQQPQQVGFSIDRTLRESNQYLEWLRDNTRGFN